MASDPFCVALHPEEGAGGNSFRLFLIRPIMKHYRGMTAYSSGTGRYAYTIKKKDKQQTAKGSDVQGNNRLVVCRYII